MGRRHTQAAAYTHAERKEDEVKSNNHRLDVEGRCQQGIASFHVHVPAHIIVCQQLDARAHDRNVRVHQLRAEL